MELWGRFHAHGLICKCLFCSLSHFYLRTSGTGKAQSWPQYTHYHISGSAFSSTLQLLRLDFLVWTPLPQIQLHQVEQFRSYCVLLPAHLCCWVFGLNPSPPPLSTQSLYRPFSMTWGDWFFDRQRITWHPHCTGKYPNSSRTMSGLQSLINHQSINKYFDQQKIGLM